jgi:uncharacterized membrane protein YbhN (UPF0104 family)
MSFSAWFKRWVRSFHRLLKVGSKPRKSEKQRKRARALRLKAKTTPQWFKKKRKYTKHPGRKNAQGIAATIGFWLTSIAVLFLPFKSAKKRHAPA